MVLFKLIARQDTTSFLFIFFVALRVIISLTFIFLFLFQLPSLLTQMVPSTASAASSVPVTAVPSTSAVSAVPVIPGNLEFLSSQGPPPIQVLESESEEDDADVLTVTIPFNSASSSTFLPMISVEDRWSTELEFRYIVYENSFFLFTLLITF